MIILQSSPSNIGTNRIDRAASDCGRVHYYPHGNRILIDGRDAHGARYIDLATGFTTSEEVDAGLWATFVALMDKVEGYNNKIAHQAQVADFARQDARNQAEAAAIGRLGGYYE